MSASSVSNPLAGQAGFVPGNNEEHECPFCGACIHQDWLLAHLNVRHRGWPEGLFRKFWGEPGKQKNPARTPGAASESTSR